MPLKHITFLGWLLGALLVLFPGSAFCESEEPCRFPDEKEGVTLAVETFVVDGRKSLEITYGSDALPQGRVWERSDGRCRALYGFSWKPYRPFIEATGHVIADYLGPNHCDSPLGSCPEPDARTVLRLYRDGRLFRRFRLGDLAPARPRSSPHCAQKPVDSIGFDPDFKQLQIVTCDGDAVLIDMAAGEISRRLKLEVPVRRLDDGREQIRPVDAFGRPHGEWVALDRRGRVEQKVAYNFGQADLWTRYAYDEDARKPACEMTWDGWGKPVGEWTCLDDHKSLREFRRYENGMPVEIVLWDDDDARHVRKIYSPGLLPTGLWVWRDASGLPVETALFSNRSKDDSEGRMLGGMSLSFPGSDPEALQPDALDEAVTGLETLGRCLVEHGVPSATFTALWPYRKQRRQDEAFPRFFYENGDIEQPGACFEEGKPGVFSGGQVVRIRIGWQPGGTVDAALPRFDPRLPVVGTESKALLRFE